MRPTIALVALAAAALLTSSCDTTQPLQLEEQTFLLSFAGTDVVGIRNFDVFDAYEDNNGDSQPDRPQESAPEAESAGDASP